MRARILLAAALATPLSQADPVARFDDVGPSPAPSAAPPRPPAAVAPPAPAAERSPVAPVRIPEVTRRSRVSGSSALTERGARFEAEGRVADALAAYSEALRLDSRNGTALIRLAALRLGMGNTREAEQLLGAATRTDEAARAFAERARIRRSQGRDDEATLDLARSVELSPEDRARLEELAASYARRRAWLPALAAFRRHAAETREPADLKTARLTVHALEVVAGDLDPVTRGRDSRSFARRMLARLARR